MKFLIDEEHDPDLMPTKSDCGQEFEYRLLVDFGMAGGTINIQVFDGPVTFFGMGGEKCDNEIFRGSVDEYRAWIASDPEF